MVDRERVDRLLARLAEDVRVLDGHRARGEELLTDPTALAADLDAFVRQVTAWTDAAE